MQLFSSKFLMTTVYAVLDEQWRRDRGGLGEGTPPLLLKILTEFSPILGYAFSHFGVGFLPFWGFFPKVDKVIFSHFGSFSPIFGSFSPIFGPFSPIFGQKLPGNPPENLKNQDGEQKKKKRSSRLKIWAEDRKFSEKSNGHPMEQTFSAFLPF
jgi:hypothetical protein